MGLGGYLAAKTDAEHYASERLREFRETVELPDVETEEVVKVFRDYGLSAAQMEPIVHAITSDQSRWVDFMMRFELGLEEPDPARAGRSAATIAASYIVGGLDSARALYFSEAYCHGAVGFGGRDAARSVRFRVDQRTLHGRQALAGRGADRFCGRFGCGRCLFYRPT